MTSLAELTPLTEQAFQDQIVQLARIYGWEDFHVRAGRSRDSWRVPGSGSMAAGWPDLVLVRPPQLLFVEVKTDVGKLTEHQGRVLELLGRLMVGSPEIPEDFPLHAQGTYLDGVFVGMDKALKEGPKIGVYVWRPKDWAFIERELAG